jgi:hypothetical protein
MDLSSAVQRGKHPRSELTNEANELLAAWKDVFPDPATAPAFVLMELGLPDRVPLA